jgi:hypothetical protein
VIPRFPIPYFHGLTPTRISAPGQRRRGSLLPLSKSLIQRPTLVPLQEGHTEELMLVEVDRSEQVPAAKLRAFLDTAAPQPPSSESCLNIEAYQDESRKMSKSSRLRGSCPLGATFGFPLNPL